MWLADCIQLNKWLYVWTDEFQAAETWHVEFVSLGGNVEIRRWLERTSSRLKVSCERNRHVVSKCHKCFIDNPRLSRFCWWWRWGAPSMLHFFHIFRSSVVQDQHPMTSMRHLCAGRGRHNLCSQVGSIRFFLFTLQRQPVCTISFSFFTFTLVVEY